MASRTSQAIHVLDRFHVMQLMGKAINEVRAEEVKQLKLNGYEPILKLKRPTSQSQQPHWQFHPRDQNDY